MCGLDKLFELFGRWQLKLLLRHFDLWNLSRWIPRDQTTLYRYIEYVPQRIHCVVV
jgi:hypothetical protein